MPDPQIQTVSRIEWSVPGGGSAFVALMLLVAGLMVFSLVREGRVSGKRWSFLFGPLRLAVAAVLAWMLCAPTRVETIRRVFPRTIGVYVDASSSMATLDQPDPAADQRWQEAAAGRPTATGELDRALLHAAALRRRLQEFADLVEQDAPARQQQAVLERLRRHMANCREIWSSPIVTAGLPPGSERERDALLKFLSAEIEPVIERLSLRDEPTPSEREQAIDLGIEACDQLVARCQLLAAEPRPGAAPAPDSGAGPGLTRLERAVPALAAALRGWSGARAEQGFLTRLYEFAESASPLAEENWQELLLRNAGSVVGQPVRDTRLDELLRSIRDEAARGESGAAVVITDGRQTFPGAEDPRELAGQLGVPLFVIPIGSGEFRRDVVMHHIQAPATVVRNDSVVIGGILTALRCAGETCEIELAEGPTIHDRRRITFRESQEDQRFQFEVATTDIGRRKFQLRASLLPDELTPDNNHAAIEVNVVNATLRVLVADQRPRWEYRYLINLWEREPRMEHDQLIFSPRAAGTGRRTSRQFPQTVDEWNEYGAVILGDVGPRQLDISSQEALRDYVSERGGSLIVIAGTEMPQAFSGQPLEQLVPVGPAPGFKADPGGYRLELTPEGQAIDSLLLDDGALATDRIWREMSESLPIYSFSSWHRLKPTAQTLMRAVPVKGGGAPAGLPFLSWQTVGAGRVLFVAAPSTYQLRLRHGDTYHHRFWGQLVRWATTRPLATGAKTVKIHADKTDYDQREKAQIRIDMADVQGAPVKDAGPIVEAESGGRVIAQVALAADPKFPGRYVGEFAPPAPGQFQLRAAGPDVDWLLKSEHFDSPVETRVSFHPEASRELRDTRSDRPLLEQLAERTGGLVLEPTTLAELPQVVPLESRVEEVSARIPLWNRWWCLAVILSSLTLEWLIRRRAGLA